MTTNNRTIDWNITIPQVVEWVSEKKTREWIAQNLGVTKSALGYAMAKHGVKQSRILRGNLTLVPTRVRSDIDYAAIHNNSLRAQKLAEPAVKPRRCSNIDCREWHTPSSRFIFTCKRCKELKRW